MIPGFSFPGLYGLLPPDRHTSFSKYPFKFDTRAICYAVSLWFSSRTLPNLHLIMWSIWLAKGFQLYQNPLEFIMSPRSEEARMLTSPAIYRVVIHNLSQCVQNHGSEVIYAMLTLMIVEEPYHRRKYTLIRQIVDNSLLWKGVGQGTSAWLID